MSADRIEDFMLRLMDDGIEPNVEIMACIVGREEAEKKLEEWRFTSLARRAAGPLTEGDADG